MMRISKHPYLLLASILTLFILSSCGDDTTSGIDQSEIPSTPGFINAFMADEIFDDNDEPAFSVKGTTSRENFLERVHTGAKDGKLTPGAVRPQQNQLSDEDENGDNDLSNFEIANELVSELRLSLQSVQFLYYQLFLPVTQRSPEVSDDTYIWEYQMPVQDSEIVLNTRITVQPAGGNDNYRWSMTISGLYEDDTSIEVETFDATSSFDGTTGSARTSMPVLMGGETFESEITWNVQGNMFLDMSLDFEFNDEEADQIRTVATYLLDPDQSTVTLTDAWAFVEDEIDTHFEANWHVDLIVGSVTIDYEELCWDEGYQNTACE